MQSPLVPGLQELLDGVLSPTALVQTDMGYGLGVPTGEAVSLAAELRETRQAMLGLTSALRDQYRLQLELAAAQIKTGHGQ